MDASGIITLTSDFGLEDPYVGIMKGVVISINPHARIIDISHSVEPGSIMHGGCIIREAYSWFPVGTVHVVVVDPGVGSGRRPIVVIQEGHFFVGPDNGLFSPIFSGRADAKVLHLKEDKFFLSHVSSTFHGRDVFAPVAAHLSRGADAAQMGEEIADPVIHKIPAPSRTKDILRGEVLREDHFGNLITNISREELEQFSKSSLAIFTIGNIRLKGVCNTYSDVTEGELLALIGSSGYLEIAINKGSASEWLASKGRDARGMEVKIIRG